MIIFTSNINIIGALREAPVVLNLSSYYSGYYSGYSSGGW